ncbi:MAG: radical SAM protein [Pseudomonadota bacterium]
MRQGLHLYIDVVGTCNLRCPSCPVGNSPGVKNARGAMSLEMLTEILDKAAGESELKSVALFNWTEPFVHPRLHELVALVKARGLPCNLSTNLNIDKPERYRAVLAAGPRMLRVSVSGFTQGVYGLTHAGGDVERVKQSLSGLAEMRRSLRSPTRLAVAYHRYRSSLAEEQEFSVFCANLGIAFQPHHAFMLPLEKVLTTCGEVGYSPLTDEDRAVLANLSLPLDAALREAATQPGWPCALLEEQVVLNCRGEVLQCCATFDESRFTLGRFLDRPLVDIQAARRQADVCQACVRHGVSNYYQYRIPSLDNLTWSLAGPPGSASPGGRV